MIDLLTIAPRACHIFYPQADIYCSDGVIEAIKATVREPEFVEFVAQHYLYMSIAGVLEDDRHGEYFITVNQGQNKHRQLRVQTTADRSGKVREVVITLPGEKL